QLRVDPHAELDERGHPPGHPYPARVRSVDARHDLQQGALAGAVAPDDPEELSPVDVERHVAQRVELAVLDPGQGMHRALLERVDLVLGDAEGLIDPTGL